MTTIITAAGGEEAMVVGGIESSNELYN